MNRQMLGLLGTFLFFVVVCVPAWATDMVWAPRTPAGGGYIDPDYYFRMIEMVEHGPDTVQVSESFGGTWIGRGYWEEDDGRVSYFYENGERADLNEVTVDNDKDNQPFGVLFYEPSQTVTTIK